MIGERPGRTIRWISSSRANSACLADFRHGPILFAGDAAHLIPIFGIRCLNSGVEDAWTLAWKLASTVKGADSSLLESYSIERVAAARENMAAANRSTRVMTPDTPGLRLLRDAVLELAVDEPAVQDVLNPRQGTPAAAHGSPLNPPKEPASFTTGPRPGEGLPDIAIKLAHPAGERSATHLLGLLDPTAFTVLVVGDLDPELADLVQSTRAPHRAGGRAAPTDFVANPGHRRWPARHPPPRNLRNQTRKKTRHGQPLLRPTRRSPTASSSSDWRTEPTERG